MRSGWRRQLNHQHEGFHSSRVSPGEAKESDPEFRDEESAADSCHEVAVAENEADPATEAQTTGTDAPRTERTSDSPAAKWRRRRIVTVYFVTVTLLFADMNLMAPNLTEIAEEFGFDENERDVKLGGLIALTFFFVGAPVSFLIGWLADSVNRSPLYAATVLFGEAACFATYFVQNYPQLVVTRTMTGISVGGAIPVIYSVLSDLYPANQRAAISALVFTGTGLGAGVGQVLAGFLGEQYGWRLPFLVVSVPAFFCALFLFAIKDPERGRNEAAKLDMDAALKDKDEDSSRIENLHIAEEVASNLELCSRVIPNDKVTAASIFSTPSRSIRVERKDSTLEEGHVSKRPDCTTTAIESEADPTFMYSENSTSKPNVKVSWRTTWEMLKIPSVALTVIQAAPGALPFGFGSVFLNDYFQENRGMTKEKATGILLAFGVGNALGVISGGVCGHQAYKRDKRGPPILMGSSLIVACIPMYLLVNLVDDNTGSATASVICAFAGFFATLPVPLERAILANVTVPESRGRANSMLSIVDDLGKGLGPAIVSLIISATDRQTAFNISLLGWVVAGILSFFIACFVRNDEDRVQEKVRESLEKNDALNQST